MVMGPHRVFWCAANFVRPQVCVHSAVRFGSVGRNAGRSNAVSVDGRSASRNSGERLPFCRGFISRCQPID